MPLFFYTQLPCCTLRSCGHLCVSRVFTFFFSQLGGAVMWFWPFTPFPPKSVVHQNHSCAILPVRRWQSSRSTRAVPNPFFVCLFLRKRLSVGCSTVGAGEASWDWVRTRWARWLPNRRSGSFGRKKSVGFSLCGPPTRCVLWWLCHKRIAEWSFPLCSIKIRTFVQCNHTPLSTSWRHLIFVVIYSCHKTPSLKYQSLSLTFIGVCVYVWSLFQSTDAKVGFKTQSNIILIIEC